MLHAVILGCVILFLTCSDLDVFKGVDTYVICVVDRLVPYVQNCLYEIFKGNKLLTGLVFAL
jgi:hypothetical protein